MFGFTVRHNPSQQIYVWVYSATHPGLRPPLSERGWRGSDLLIIKTMRREGMARQRFIDNQNDAAAHPLSERGARSAGCVAPSNTVNPGVCRTVKYLYSPGVAPSNIVNLWCVALSNWISDGSGQSVVLLSGRCAQNLKKI